MPFEKAAPMLEPFLGGQVRSATARRMTERAGAHVDAAHTAECTREDEWERGSTICVRHAISADEASVPLVKGQWADVRTRALGDGGPWENTRGTQEVPVTRVSSFSRMTPASTGVDLASGELRRSGVWHAQAGCAITDGADRVQGCLDVHRLDAVRIQDVPHAAEQLNKLVDARRQAGVVLPETVRDRRVPVLTHRGPAWVRCTCAKRPADICAREAVRE
jgi:hypothetical protein